MQGRAEYSSECRKRRLVTDVPDKWPLKQNPAYSRKLIKNPWRFNLHGFLIFSKLCVNLLQLPRWWNWYTHTVEGRGTPCVRVRVPPWALDAVKTRHECVGFSTATCHRRDSKDGAREARDSKNRRCQDKIYLVRGAVCCIYKLLNKFYL